MFHSKLSRSIHVSHLEFTLSNSTNARDGQAGRASFFVNNFIEFRNIPIQQRPDGEIAIDLIGTGNAISSGFLREEVCQEIQRQVVEQLAEVVS